MEVPEANPLALVVHAPTPSFQGLLDSQKELLCSQIDRLQDIVVTQCKLTGVNPLSQEMAAGALSIKIGKRPRDLLNPKAIKYMQAVFSIKDEISKKESRIIGALFGVTATQVREFFTGQRTRVRRFVRLSREKANRSNASIEVQDGPSCSDSNIPIHPVPLNSVGPTSTEGPSCSTQDEVPPGIDDDSDKYFLANIYGLMRKEETFSGQVKLMEWILQIQNAAVLNWFLIKGGVMILATWLSQAAIEEQTSVLHVVLKVLCHLPLHKALPAHMSAILQSVNRLRFYRTSDISNRAKILLARWSKIFARSQAMRKPNAIISPGDAQDEILLKQSIGEIMGSESWESKADAPDGTLIPYENLENSRNLGSSQPMKLLMSSTDDYNKKLLRGVSSSQTRERRKVQLVEQPGQKMAGRNLQVSRSVPATQGRPLSADDIQKAKLRAQFMQSKYGKNVTSSADESPQVKREGSMKSSSSPASIMLTGSKAHCKPKVEEHKKPMKFISKVSNHQEATLQKVSFEREEPLWKKCKRSQIPWRTPPEMIISKVWRVSTGEDSKEVEIQKNRTRREKVVTYNTVQEIPLNPNGPWDREMDYDDSLTPEIPIQQPADGSDSMEMETMAPVSTRESPEAAVTNGSTSGVLEDSNSTGNNMPEPDLELLAVLLKNPEVVFALTSGQGGNLSSEQMVKVLDMIKASGSSSMSSLINGLVERKAEEKVEVSLPSPTPSSNPVTSGWPPETAKNPFSRQNVRVNGEEYAIPGVSLQEKLPSGRLVQPQIAINGMAVPPLTQQASLPSMHQRAGMGSPNVKLHPDPSRRNIPVSSPSFPTLLNSPSRSTRDNSVATARTSDVSVVMNASSSAAFFLPPAFPPAARSQPQLQPEPRVSGHSWRGRQGLAPSAYSQANHTNYNTYGQGPLPAGPPWERNGYRVERGYESWSPDNSPVRSQEHMGVWGYSEPRMNMGQNYRPEMSRRRDPSGFQDHSRNGNPRRGGRKR